MSVQGRLAAIMSVANQDVLAYTVPEDTVTTATIAAVKTGDDPVSVSIFIHTSPNHLDSDAIEYGAIIAPGGVLERSCMPLGAGEHLTINASTSKLAVRVAGFEADI